LDPGVPLIQVVSLVGAATILLAYAANQFGRLQAASLAYAAANAAGAATLTVVAAVERQWGFLLLEAAWTAVSVTAIAGMAARGRTARS
jgi:hypothetical protein